MSQYIKFVQEPTGFKMYVRLEKGAEPFPESRRDSYWFCDFDGGYCWAVGVGNGDCELSDLGYVPNFRAVVENKSDADANGVFRLKVGQKPVRFWYLAGEGDKKRTLRISTRDDFVNALGESCGVSFKYTYHADEISAERATSECPEILAWSPPAAPAAAPAVTLVVETADTLAREEIAALRSEMDARQKRTDAIMAAAIHNLDEKISAK